MKQLLKRMLFAALGKEPDAVVVTFLSGRPELAERMAAEMRNLVSGRRHIFVRREGEAPVEGGRTVFVWGESAWFVWARLRRELSRYRIGLAPTLFDGSPEYAALRRAALLLAPGRVLAWNGRLERHHLRVSDGLASLLFLCGVSLDRIFLRPGWLFPWNLLRGEKDRTVIPQQVREIEGRPLSADRRRVAVLTPYFPYPLSHGGAVRIYSLLREASKTFDIFLFSFLDRETDADLEPMREFCARLILAGKPRYREPRWSTLAPPEVCEFHSPPMKQALRRVCRESAVPVLQVEYTQLAGYGGDILVEHDITFDLFGQVRRERPSFSASWNWWRWHRLERAALRKTPHVVVMSEKDTGLARACLPEPSAPKVHVLPNGVDLQRFAPVPEPDGANLLFVGSFRHFPNIVAFEYFVRDVWPAVKRHVPEARLTVVAGPDHILYWRSHTGAETLPDVESLEVHGFVADVAPLYRGANLVVVPTLVSAGTNLKVLEAMAIERAVVSTPSGCAGLGLEHGASVWVAADAAAFATGVVTLLRHPALRRRISLAARALAEQCFDWRSIAAEQCRLWSAISPRSPLAVRPATLADLPAIEEIQRLSPAASQWHVGAYLQHSCLVAERNGAVAGFLVTREVAPGEREVLNFATHPAHRRHGVASLLLRTELSGFSGTYFLEVRESNLEAISLYEKTGFRRSGTRPAYYENPQEAGIVMKLQS